MERVKNRLLFVDIAKGICIILVVLGHVLDKTQGLHHYIYSIHIPFFIILSGFFERKQTDFRKYLLKTFRRLYLPFIAFIITDYIIIGLMYKTSLTFLLEHILKGAAGMENGYDFPIWFLFDLFIVKIVFQGFHLIENKKIRKFAICAVLSICLMYMYLSRFIAFNNRFWPIYSVLPFMAYYCLGYFLKRVIKYIADVFEGENHTDKLLLTLVMSLFFFLLIPLTQMNGDAGLFGCKFNNTTLFIINSLLGSFGCLILSCMIAGSRSYKPKLLPFFGKHSLIVQVTHYYITSYLISFMWKSIGQEELRFLHQVEFSSFCFAISVCFLLIVAKVHIHRYYRKFRLLRHFKLQHN